MWELKTFPTSRVSSPFATEKASRSRSPTPGHKTPQANTRSVSALNMRATSHPTADESSYRIGITDRFIDPELCVSVGRLGGSRRDSSRTSPARKNLSTQSYGRLPRIHASVDAEEQFTGLHPAARQSVSNGPGALLSFFVMRQWLG